MPNTHPVDLYNNGFFDGIVDVYRENEPFSPVEAKRLGVKAVIYRAGMGLTSDDRTAYHAAKTAAHAAGVLWGAYFVVTAKPVDDLLERLFEIEDCSDPNVLVAIDWERSKSEGLMGLHQMREFLKKFYRRAGFWPMVYGGRAMTDILGSHSNDELLKCCPLWYIRLLPAGDYNLLVPAPWTTCTLWQFDDEHREHSAPYEKRILAGVDWSRFRGTSEDLEKVWPWRWTEPHLEEVGE